MAYSTIAAAQSRVRDAHTLSTTSTPTLAEATAFGAGVTGEIDSALASHGVTTPVAAPAAFVAWLADVEANGWALRIAAAMMADASGENSDEAASKLERMYRDAMKRLWDGTAIPPSLSVSSSSLPSSDWTKYPDEPPTLGANQVTAFGSDWAS